MIKLDVPGYDCLQLEYVVLDFNGTIGLDGKLVSGVAERILQLASLLEIHVLTADTNGTCTECIQKLPVTLHVLGPGREDYVKRDYVKNLGRTFCVAIGNGINDRLMLESAEIGICVVGDECCAVAAAYKADVLAPNICAALDMLLKSHRMIATLRS